MNSIVKLLTILLLAIGVFFAIFSKEPITPPVPVVPAVSQDISQIPIFAQGLEASGIVLNDIGYHTFSPDGKYFIFTGIKDTDPVPAKTYMVTLATGIVKELPDILLGDVTDSRLVALFKGTDLILYDIEKETSERIATDGNVVAGALSPDGSTYMLNTLKGIRQYNRLTKELKTVTTRQYDGATAWFSDSNRMLGFKETGENLFEAGKGREFGVWNISNGTFAPIVKGKILDKSIRNVTWIIRDQVARVNTGWDDGSRDYLVDITTETVVDLGDTSGSLMGGIREDENRQLFAVIQGYGDISKEITASTYNGIKKVATATLPAGYFRESVQIVNKDTLIYIRKQLNEKQGIGAVVVVQLDVNTGVETVLKELPIDGYARVSLAKDYLTWVVSSKNNFYVGKVK